MLTSSCLQELCSTCSIQHLSLWLINWIVLLDWYKLYETTTTNERYILHFLYFYKDTFLGHRWNWFILSTMWLAGGSLQWRPKWVRHWLLAIVLFFQLFCFAHLFCNLTTRHRGVRATSKIASQRQKVAAIISNLGSLRRRFHLRKHLGLRWVVFILVLIGTQSTQGFAWFHPNDGSNRCASILAISQVVCQKVWLLKSHDHCARLLLYSLFRVSRLNFVAPAF